MQNSALSFSFVVDQQKVDIDQVLNLFKARYEIKFNKDLELVTIRHYDQETIDRLTQGKEVILEQKTRQTVRLLAKNVSA